QCACVFVKQSHAAAVVVLDRSSQKCQPTQGPTTPSMTWRRPLLPTVTWRTPTPPRLTCRRPTPPRLICRRPTPPRLICRRPTPPRLIYRRPTPPRLVCRRPSPPRLICRRPSPPRLICRRPTPPRLICRRPTPPRLICRRPTPPRLICRRPSPPRLICRRPTPPRLICRRPTPPRLIGRRPIPPRLICRRPAPPRLICRRPVPPWLTWRRPPPPRLIWRRPISPSLTWSSIMMELKEKMRTLQTEKLALQLRDMQHDCNVKEMKEEFTQETKAMRQQIMDLEAEKEELVSEHDKTLKAVREEHTQVVEDLNLSMHGKLRQEYEASHLLQQELEECRQQLQSAETGHKRAIEQLTNSYEEEHRFQLQQCKDKAQWQKMEYELILKTMAEEIFALRCKYKAKSKTMRDMSAQYKDEARIMKKRFECLGEIKSKRIEKLEAEVKKNLNIISNLENDVLGLKQQIMLRNENIQEKNSIMMELKEKMQTLQTEKLALQLRDMQHDCNVK
ncbi:hypothetical protein COCON_G00236490, partial [Conger conger]